MNLSSISLARATILVEAESLDPKGRAFLPDVLQAFGSKYTFAKVPQKFEDIDPQKGIKFEMGKARDVVVDSLTIFKDGLVVDTRSSTEDSESVALDLIAFAAQAFGATVKPTRKLLISQLVFTSALNLSLLHPALEIMAKKVSDAVSETTGQRFDFEPSAIMFSPDYSLTKLSPARFTIERRAEMPFAEKTYFSSAPLRTAEHIALVEQIETALGG